MKRILLNNRGITIVEVVIAMTLVIIITSISMTISVSSMKLAINSERKFIATNRCSDFIEVFQEETDRKDFIKFLKKNYDCALEYKANGTISFIDDNVEYNIFILRNTIMTTAFLDEEKICSFTYIRG